MGTVEHMTDRAKIDETTDEAGPERLGQRRQPAGPRRLGGWGHVVLHDDALPPELEAAFRGDEA